MATSKGGKAISPKPDTKRPAPPKSHSGVATPDQVKGILGRLQISSTTREWMSGGAARLKDGLIDRLALLDLDEAPASELAQLYADARVMSDEIGSAIKVLSDHLVNLSSERIPRAFEDEKIKSFTTMNGYRVTVSTSLYASIKADQKLDAYQWLRKNQLGALIIETVNTSTLSATARIMLSEGKELPEDMFSSYTQNTTSLTKVGKK